MTTTQERVLAAMERWERQASESGLSRCTACGDWNDGTGECEACESVRPVVTLAMVVGLAMVCK